MQIFQAGSSCRVAAPVTVFGLLLITAMLGLVCPARGAANRNGMDFRVRGPRQVADEDRPVVINGLPVTSRSNNQFSSLARVYLNLFGLPLGSCTGSLVSVRYVLTAGHCVKTAVKFLLGRFKYTDFSVVLGDLDSTQTESGEQTISGIGIPFPLYPTTTSAVDPTDIALIKLKQDATLSSTVQLASLPSSGYSPADGSQALVAGWGVFEEGGQGDGSTLLRYGTVKVNASSASCGVTKFSSKHICFGPLNSGTATNQTVCYGDSGGPVMQQVNGKYVVIATVSFGETNCPLNAENISGGVSVAAYLKWLKKYI